MPKWIYAYNNGYDYIAKIENGKARVLTDTKDFPNMSDDWFDLTEQEKYNRIQSFMEDVIHEDYSREWDEYDANVIFEEIENHRECGILWEKEIPTSITEIRALTGLKMTKFAERYKIPYRTLQDWEAGKSKPPAYVLPLLERCVKEDFKEER